MFFEILNTFMRPVFSPSPNSFLQKKTCYTNYRILASVSTSLVVSGLTPGKFTLLSRRRRWCSPQQGKYPKPRLELIPVDVSEQSEGVHYLKCLIQIQTTTASASRSFLRLTERNKFGRSCQKDLRL